jgi:replicative DNA helicase
MSASELAPAIEYRAANGANLVALGERNRQPVRAIATPWETWNDACRGRGGFLGLAHGWHVLLAGASGRGKTYAAANLAAAAVLAGETVAFHSLEMDWDELTTRMLAIVGREPAWKLSPGKYYDHHAFERASERLDEARGEFIANQEPINTLRHVSSGIRRMHEFYGARLHIVDYLQLAWVKSAESAVDRITEVSHTTRQIAKELGVVTLGLSQLNRAGSGERAVRPTKENMIGASALENDADQVVLIDHSRLRQTTGQDGKPSGWTGWLVLDKNRHGPGAEVAVQFQADTGTLRERLPDEVEDWETQVKESRR